MTTARAHAFLSTMHAPGAIFSALRAVRCTLHLTFVFLLAPPRVLPTSSTPQLPVAVQALGPGS
eukprot:scaffold127953_cov60-Phaeocystis_antarctica.AAC.4